MSVRILPPSSRVECAGGAERKETLQLSLAPWTNVRFGITVPKRLARRAVARNTVKRVVREAARHAAGPLTDAAPTQQLEVVIRLKSPLPEASRAGWAKVKADLRSEADQLLGQLRAQLLARQEERQSGSGGTSRRAVTEELAKSARSSDREPEA